MSRTFTTDAPAAASPVAEPPPVEFSGPAFTGPALAAPVRPTRIAVAFSGDGHGIEELSWGQWEIWLATVRQRASLRIGGTIALSPGTTVHAVAEELGYFMSRYQALRTRLTFDADDRPRQCLSASGEIGLMRYEAGAADPEDVAAAVEARWAEADFDYVREWPVRMAVVTKAGIPAFLVAFTSHLSIDGAGAAVMAREAASRTTAPIDGMQPFEQARWQRSADGRRQNESVLRYVDRALRSLPAHGAPTSADPRDPRYWSGRLHSRALRLALRAIARRTATDSSSVLLALYAIAVGRVAGVGPVAVRSVVGNRFRPGLADVVCAAAQSGLCVLDVADVTVDEAIERARRAAVLASKHAYHDPETLSALIDRLNRDRAAEIDVERYFNDRRSPDAGPPSDLTITPDLLTAALADTEFRWGPRRNLPFERLFLHADDASERVALLVEGDTHHYAPAQLEALARTVEAIAVRAAFDPALPTGVTGAPTDA